MIIYNTLKRQKEEFKSINPNQVKIYSCGPTVYNFIHIGNARPICVFDTLRRYLEFKGNKVVFVQNFTDVDDKIINKANDQGISPEEIAKTFIDEYKKDAKGLNVKPADFHPTVTENIENIIKMIKTLIEKDYAYSTDDGDVYFKTQNFNQYGKLSHMPMEDLEAGARVEVFEKKENPMDFALWKSAKPNEPYWNSPWGKGRPGWHIECSAMSKNILGDTIDIHCGGQDLIFPHHENEIAQSECCNGANFANYWMHNGYINIDNKKMSKSDNNFFTVREISERYGYEVIRYLMLQAQYRTPINYSEDIIKQCQASLDRLYNCKENMENVINSLPNGIIDENIKQKILDRKQQFINAMDDDLNTADAITCLFELSKDINILISENNINKDTLEFCKKTFEQLSDVLGLLYKTKEIEIPQNVLNLVEKRKQARQNKDFSKADEIRDEILNLGFEVKETRQGVAITPIKK